MIVSDFDLEAWLMKQKQFSKTTFGEGRRTKGLIKHITKELGEIEQRPTDLFEWIDVAILAFDGAWRAGYSPDVIVAALELKLQINKSREWPAPKSEDEPIEHVRDGEKTEEPDEEEEVAEPAEDLVSD
jgi:hypothetical protein